MRIAAVLAMLLAATAEAQTISRPLVRVTDDGATVGTRPEINFGANITATDDPTNNRVNVTGTGGGGGGGGDVVGPASATDNEVTRFDGTTGKLIQNGTGCTLSDSGVFGGTCVRRGVVGISTCTVVTPSSTGFMAAGTCVDATEAMVEQRVAVASTFTNLECITSAAIGGGNSIVVTGRVGTCGSLADASFTCTLTGGASRSTCSSGANTMSATAGQCVSFSVAPSGSLSANPAVNCTALGTS